MHLFIPGALLVIACAVGAVAWPLLVYTTSLAALGLAHVAVELRYVQARFGDATRHRIALAVGVLLSGVVALRVLRLIGWLPSSLTTPLELALVVAMVAAPLPLLVRQGAISAMTGAAALAVLAVGIYLSPLYTLLALAVLHNWTPLGFLQEALSPAQRRRWMPVALAVFIGVPLLIATGWPLALLQKLPGFVAPELSVLPAGYLADNFGAYLPRSMHAQPWTLHAFSAIVFAQCMHYAAVLHVLPRLLPEHQQRPSSLFYGVVVGIGAALFIGFTLDFKLARQIYGIASAVHAWIELPLLLVALAAPAALAATSGQGPTTPAPGQTTPR